MSCTNPLKAWTIGINEKTGKRELKVTDRHVNHLRRDGINWICCYDDFSPSDDDSSDFIFDYDLIPCGSCYSCRMNHARDWTVRCMLEAQYHESNYFVTLTYADNHLPFNIDCESGELTGKSTLVKSHVQKFIKRLRKNYKYSNRISYLLCGEYGALSGRCHYHLCIFGLKLDDLVEYKKTPLGYSLYNSEFLSRCWSVKPKGDIQPDFFTDNGEPRSYIGYVVVAPLTYESAAYVARYTVKKQGDQDKDIYDEYMFEKEFLLTSKRPAIGYQYYQDHKDEIYKHDSIVLNDGKVVKPPKYFDKLYELDNPPDMERIKENRKNLAEISLESQLAQCDYDFDTLLGIKDLYLKERTKKLLRKEI